MIKPLREPVEKPESTFDHASQEDQHMMSVEPTENEHPIEEMPVAMSPQEEPARPLEQHVEQRQT